MKYVVKPAVTLFVTAVIVIALLSVVHGLTATPIETQRYVTQRAAMLEVMPQASRFVEIDISELKSGNIVAAYEGLLYPGRVGYVIQLAPEGYSGKIDMLVGISTGEEKKITGMRVIRHTETPGLGALAVRPEFYRKFEDRRLVPLSVVRTSPDKDEIDAITSATITTRAITYAVNEAMLWYTEMEGRLR
jgi:electron transport complex protein RnfG